MGLLAVNKDQEWYIGRLGEHHAAVTNCGGAGPQGLTRLDAESVDRAVDDWIVERLRYRPHLRLRKTCDEDEKVVARANSVKVLEIGRDFELLVDGYFPRRDVDQAELPSGFQHRYRAGLDHRIANFVRQLSLIQRLLGRGIG